MNAQTFLLNQIKQRRKWGCAFFALLAALLVTNYFVRPAHPHFGLDALPFFWAVFGLGVGCVMVGGMKKLIQPLIVRKEDYYGDI
ncbi:hypothetical protein LJC22_01850 [Desulfosarcina sp. OttesenSCG-928-G10]|nr:hypothetical protein [Desulfosarcina sp. OttesenSCG-928-G10]